MGLENKTQENGKIKLTMNQLIKGIKPYRDKMVKVVPEEGFDHQKEFHPIEDYLLKNRITYFFGKNANGGNEEVYELDLRKIEIDYNNYL